MSPSEVWSRALNILRDSVNTQTFEAWFLPTRCVAYSAEGVRIQVPNQFFADWLRENHLHLIRESLGRAIGASPPEVDFSVSDEPVRRTPPPPPQPPAPAAAPAREQRTNGCLLSERFTFDTFVVGRSNAFAHAAAQAVAENPGQAYNPLFVYGGVGLGKTHIIQAIGRRVLEKKPMANVHYASAENFMNEMIQSIQTGSTLRFK